MELVATTQQLTIDLAGSSQSKTYLPTVESPRKPRIAMEFDSIEDAYEFYNLYAREAGFSVRKRSQRKDGNNNIVYFILVCAKEGKTNPRPTTSDRQRKRCHLETREDCKAYITFKKSKESPTYFVLNFKEEHTHPLCEPAKAHLLPSHRYMSSTKKQIIETCGSANIRPALQMNVFQELSHGCENIGFCKRDLHHYNRDEREKTEGLDAQKLYKYFKGKQDENESFIFFLKKNDETGKISHVFWADPIARINYKGFGSVVSFDTTYNTNRYKMIFALFTGVNHHYRSVLLGCGFLSGETADDFLWLFNHWQMSMPGGPPRCFITDQDLGMTKAIAQVFPNTIHRYCIWHIMEKLTKNLGVIAYRPDFNYKFNGVVYNVETTEEFEEKWHKMLKKWELTENQWLSVMYELRTMWVPAYLHNNFFAGIQSTQRSENMNSLLKNHVSENNSFCQFMLRYERFIEQQRHLELIDDHDTCNNRPKMMTALAMEKQMADIYTREIFRKFQKQLFYAYACNITLHSDNEYESVFLITPPSINDNEEKKVKKGKNFDRQRKVIYEKTTRQPSCCCRKFDFMGLPCMHLLIVLRYLGVHELPKQFILERWTRNAKKVGVTDKDREIVRAIANSSLLARHSFLSQTFAPTIDEACLTKEAFKCAIELRSDMHKKLKSINSRLGAINSDNNRSCQQAVDQVEYHEPDVCRTKGSGKRLKTTSEKFRQKGRLCHGCNKCNVDHDKRNCPILNNMCLQNLGCSIPLASELGSYENENHLNF